MTNARGHILPFFIPHLGCPQQCIFCDQKIISGTLKMPTTPEILESMQLNGSQNCELAFYGGSFTAMPVQKQIDYLQAAKIGLENGWITGVRISTRPDYINDEILDRLRQYGVKTVELGVQSLNDRVLQIAKRGHSAAESLKAVQLLQKRNLITGVQLMPGLPGEDEESVCRGAAEILALKPDLLRIYPAVVVKGTAMAAMFEQGLYRPLTLEAAVKVCAVVTLLAEKYDVNVIRTGLNTDDNLQAEILAGPYHPAFGNLVKSYIWRQKVLWALINFLEQHSLDEFEAIYVAKNKLPLVFGQNADNRKYYEKILHNAKFRVKAFKDNLQAGGEDLLLTDRQGKSYTYLNEQFMKEFLRDYPVTPESSCC